MCGLTGFYNMNSHCDDDAELRLLTRMSTAITHRGPDASGHWLDTEAGIALGHRRLSIIDLSEAGAQPMKSHSGQYVIAYNGEIYNYIDLRNEFEEKKPDINWKGHSDTEVLLEMIAEDGIEQTLGKLDGMFALAVFDRKSRTLTLARDAFGEKPLYYGYVADKLLFASELKAFKANPEFEPYINQQALSDFFKYSYVPTPSSIYHGIFKLPSGSLIEFKPDDIKTRTMQIPKLWVDKVKAALAAKEQAFEGSYDDALEQLSSVLSTSTSRRMISDVSLGALLSGGIDSSLITALMQQTSSKPVKTFSIGMDAPGFNEADLARKVSQHLNTDHTELILSPQQVQFVIPDIADIYDEPFSDSSQVPTFLVSKMAKQDVTVALSGDGGDELFGGYNRYFHAPRIWDKIKLLPDPARHMFAKIAGTIPPQKIDQFVAKLGSLAPGELAAGRAGEKLQKLAKVMSANNQKQFHDNLLSTGIGTSTALTIDNPAQNLAAQLHLDEDLAFVERAMLTDTQNYMPDDILTKVDRASMAVALELRAPYLSLELYKFAWSLPHSFKIKNGKGKIILRDLLYSMVPKDIIDRPKAGFAIPIGLWLREGLREWAENDLSENALKDAGIFNVSQVRLRWDEHLSGKRNHETFLWSVLMYQNWRAKQKTGLHKI